MAVRCRLVCVSATVHCARGVRVVDWCAAPAQDIFSSSGLSEKGTDLSLTKISPNVRPDLQYLVIQLK